ncbi:hypothetical protein ACNTMW_30500 [Planosporangium sp. 12N6]|uniref:Rv0361 family membrane protein n=1 Tax=Planosporangium spinosum TaxID=3402278 RepID=UPI003CE671EB
MSQPLGYPPEPGGPQGQPTPEGQPTHQGQPGVPAAQPTDPAAHPGAPVAYPGGPATASTPRRPRTLLVTSLVLALVLLLCGGGGTTAYFLIKKVGGTGRPTPTDAVDGFLTAVFTDHDVDKATRYVCSESRDKADLAKKIDELRSFERKYRSPRYSWPTPAVQSRKGNTATLTVPIKITTTDERTAEKRLKFVAVKESGWWVCEVGDAK